MRIERDTRTDIKIPRQGENKDIVIYGPSASVISLKYIFFRTNLVILHPTLGG